MLTKLAGIVDSAYWWVICAALGAFIGCYVTSSRYEARIADEALEAAVARAEQGKKAYERLVEAQNSLDAWRSSAESMSAELDRMRNEQRSLRESADACRVERAAVARCEGLLERSTSAVARCSDLLQRDAAIHDALAESMK